MVSCMHSINNFINVRILPRISGVIFFARISIFHIYIIYTEERIKYSIFSINSFFYAFERSDHYVKKCYEEVRYRRGKNLQRRKNHRQQRHDKRVCEGSVQTDHTARHSCVQGRAHRGCAQVHNPQKRNRNNAQRKQSKGEGQPSQTCRQVIRKKSHPSRV